MGTKEMDVADVKDGGLKSFAFEYEENLSSPGNGESLLIPDDIASIVVTVSFSGGASGRVEATSDKLQTVKDDLSKWVSWVSGDVSITTQDVAYPPTSLRMVQLSAGTMKMTVRAQ